MADPVAAANALAGQTYADAQQRTAQGKQALLDQLSSNGTYNNAIDQSAVQQASPQAIQDPGTVVGGPDTTGHTAMIALAQHGANQIQAQNQAALTAAATLAAQQRATQQQAAGTYFDQVQQAIPIEQSRAASAAANTLATLQAQRDAEASAKAQAAIQLQISQNDLAKSKLASTNPLSKLSPTELQSAAKNAQASAAATLSSLTAVDGQGNVTKTPAYNAAKEMAQSGESLDAVASKYGLNPQQQQQVADAINNYNASLQQGGYFAYTGLPVPATVQIPTHATNAPNAAGLYGLLGDAQSVRNTVPVTNSQSGNW